MPVLFKKCPSCGKRFEVEHTGESVEKKTETVTEEEPTTPLSSLTTKAGVPYPILGEPDRSTTFVAEALEEDTYTETYKCKHCGHVWTEKSEVVKDLGGMKDPEFDGPT